MYRTLRHEPTADRSTKRYRHTVVGIVALATVGLTLGLGPASAAAAVTADQSDPTSPVVVTYTGAMYQFTVPQGIARLHIDAIGGDGGQNTHTPDTDHAGAGAEVTGYLNVKPGEVLDIYIGGAGANASTKDDDPAGGWSASGYSGGNGNAAKDYLRTSGAGGGATVIKIDGGDTLLVAAGGGGGGGLSGDPYDAGRGGDASTWLGQNGDHGTSGPQGGSGGAGSAASIVGVTAETTAATAAGREQQSVAAGDLDDGCAAAGTAGAQIVLGRIAIATAVPRSSPPAGRIVVLRRRIRSGAANVNVEYLAGLDIQIARHLGARAGVINVRGVGVLTAVAAKGVDVEPGDALRNSELIHGPGVGDHHRAGRITLVYRHGRGGAAAKAEGKPGRSERRDPDRGVAVPLRRPLHGRPRS